MSDLDEFKATYFDECTELLGELEEQFTAISDGDHDPDRLNAVFRAIHSIKGGGGAFGFSGLVGFAHEFETMLDHVRNGTIGLSEPVLALCLRANDIVADFVSAAREGRELPADHGAEEKARFVALTAGDDDESGEPLEEFDIDFEPVMVTLSHAEVEADDDFDASPFEGEDFAAADAPLPLEADEGLASGFMISFAPHRTLFERANEPLLLLRQLAALGEAKVTARLADPLPDLTDFDPFGTYCSWQVELTGPGVTQDAIVDVFEFVDGDCDLAIAPLSGDEVAEVEETDAFGAQAPAEDVPSFADLAATLAPAPKPAAAPVAAKVLVDPNDSGDKGGDAGAKTPVSQSIRVDLDKIDRVVNMVGELVITQSMLNQQMDESLKSKYQELVRGLEVLAQTTRGLQDSVMAIRAQPVKSVFSRMPRLVRELANKTGKSIRLEMVGEQTEIDKTVIEQLSDPLTHMIRNSSDHGIEKPETRKAARKPETGVIRLSAEQSGGSILIIVEDDGAGINRERVLKLARERGVVAPDQQLTDEQIDNLIFAPGFSTAEAVSDISGRGVGMDVVLSNIKKIGGSVHVKSWPGRGTRMTLRLPLTLAVLDVMLVRVAGSPYVVPLSSIVETMQCARAEFGRVPSGARVLKVRGEYVRVVDLAAHFGIGKAGAAEASRFVVLCEAEGGLKIALIVDDIIGQQQVVIKSLEENFERIEGVAGGTILGDGNVGLIVDVPGIAAGGDPSKAAA